MAELREVCVGDRCYYYLFGYVKGKKFRKYAKFIGTKKPILRDLNKHIKIFDEEIGSGKEIPKRQDVNFIRLLQDLQEKEGYLPEDEIVRISKELEVPAAELYGVATFYSQFKLKKKGRCNIGLCQGTACHVKHSDILLTHLEKKLGIKSGNTDKEGEFSLEVVNCVGACAKAPAMMVNGKVYGELSDKKLDEILDDYGVKKVKS
jgi:NADH-quinone oxidoreductase subunit E